MNSYINIMIQFYSDVAIIGISWALLRKAANILYTVVTTGRLDI